MSLKDGWRIGLVIIDDTISYIPDCRAPLSADVGVIKGNKKTWIFDIGSSDAVFNEIKSI